MEEAPEIAVSLFCTFRACAETSPNYESQGKKFHNGRRKNEPRAGNGTGQASSSGRVHEGAVTEGG
eukprot:9432763-Alexandrium_andersonii.AAC.1